MKNNLLWLWGSFAVCATFYVLAMQAMSPKDPPINTQPIIEKQESQEEKVQVEIEMQVEEGGQDVIKPASDCAIKLLGEEVREEVSLWFTNYNINSTKYGNGRLEYTIRLDGKFIGNSYGEKSFWCEVDVSNGCSGTCTYQ